MSTTVYCSASVLRYVDFNIKNDTRLTTLANYVPKIDWNGAGVWHPFVFLQQSTVNLLLILIQCTSLLHVILIRKPGSVISVIFYLYNIILVIVIILLLLFSLQTLKSNILVFLLFTLRQWSAVIQPYITLQPRFLYK